MNNLPAFLPLAEAARKYGLDAAHLKSMVAHGTIRAVTVKGEIVVDENSLPLRKEDLPEYKKHAHLKGHAIWISEAERKYTIPNPTISRWAKLGFIKRLGVNGNKVMLDEADVAYCAEIYHSRNPKQGRRLFDASGVPYKPKTGPLAV